MVTTSDGKLWLYALAVLVLSALIAACGADDSADSGAGSESTAEGGSEDVTETDSATTEADDEDSDDETEESEGDSTISDTHDCTADDGTQIGPLWTFELNDRCADPAWSLQQVKDLGFWNFNESPPDNSEFDADPENGDTVPCKAIVAAIPDELLVATTDRELADDLDYAITEFVVPHLNAVLASADISQDIQILGLTETSRRLLLPRGTPVDLILPVLPALQGEYWVTDLNYLNPVQPNNSFRPDDNPMPAPGDDSDEPDEASEDSTDESTDAESNETSSDPQVIVFDSTAEVDRYDTEHNDLVDEDHGHGVFVASLIERQAGTIVELRPVEPNYRTQEWQDRGEGTQGDGPTYLSMRRWSPMAFSDADLMMALQDEDDGKVLNLSLGGAGCTATITEALGHGVGEHLALATEFKTRAPSAILVAAAGNQGKNVKHFPAAWRDPDFGQRISADAEALASDENVEATDEQRAQWMAVPMQFQMLREHYQDSRLYAVGSVSDLADRTTRSDFSNCGDWINVVAEGELQLGLYPDLGEPTPGSADEDDKTLLATWSGTSFATANATAELLLSQQISEARVGALAVLVEGLDC